MNLMMKTVAIAGVAAISGCAMFMEPLPKTTVPLTPTDKVFEYPKEAPNGQTISERDLLGSMEMRIRDATDVLTVDEYAQHLKNSKEVKGLKVKQGDNQFDVSFVNGQRYSNYEDGPVHGTWIRATYEVFVEDAGDSLRMTVATPSEFVVEPGRQPNGTPIEPMFNQDQAEQKFQQINEGIAPVLTFGESITGSIESPRKPDSVSDNFDRLLEKNTVNGEYEVTAAGQTATAKVEIFSYREGSKVEYQLLYNYQAKGDGSFTRSQEEIDALVDRLRQVATD